MIELISINDCLDTTLNIISNELKHKAEISKEYGDLPPVRGSAQQLNQVFMNILVNAAQAIQKKGKISIRTWRKNNGVRVRSPIRDAAFPNRTCPGFLIRFSPPRKWVKEQAWA
ncbi:MAG: hypothetical protein MUO63_06930 [Desulfobulbaceae bacterium]|nr:hypothetical protein [Desulfobulbaceae bacterium]